MASEAALLFVSPLSKDIDAVDIVTDEDADADADADMDVDVDAYSLDFSPIIVTPLLSFEGVELDPPFVPALAVRVADFDFDWRYLLCSLYFSLNLSIVLSARYRSVMYLLRFYQLMSNV